MKKNQIVLMLLLVSFSFSLPIFAHDASGEHKPMRKWMINNKQVNGDFFFSSYNQVKIEGANHEIKTYPLTVFSKVDQLYISEKSAEIAKLNKEIPILEVSQLTNKKAAKNSSEKFIIPSFVVLFGLTSLSLHLKRKKLQRYSLAILAGGIGYCLYSFTDPTVVDSAFTPFSPNVVTSWDTDYFYVESKGIPSTHDMMVGISNHGWQQQVPLPHCYTETNHWSIPLNPVMAATPVPVNASHFVRGAIAIAVNGVPIFNVYTNTGVDSYLDGQLDFYGGHCGRGDDYHYHTAPLHLYNQTSSTLPIAYALDGYAVFGNIEPDGAPMTTLDANHGHLYNSTYHYHGTANAPYMIAKMVGQVTEDASLQIIPQPQGAPVRTENWGPLTGALITSCLPNGTNDGYNLTYTLNGTPGYATNYSWNGTGVYIFDYVTPSGTTTTSYNGFLQCTLLANILNNTNESEDIFIYPNPTNRNFSIQMSEAQQKSVKQISIYSLSGNQVYSKTEYEEKMDFSNLHKGIYIVKINFDKSEFIKKVIIQ